MAIRDLIEAVVNDRDLAERQREPPARAKQRQRPARIVAANERIGRIGNACRVVVECPLEHIPWPNRRQEERLEIAMHRGDRHTEVSYDRIRRGSSCDAQEKKDDGRNESTFLHSYPPL
jgi:hypothetical protein